jgi:hypothetical protein
LFIFIFFVISVGIYPVLVSNMALLSFIKITYFFI